MTFSLTATDEATGKSDPILGEGAYHDLADFVR